MQVQAYFRIICIWLDTSFFSLKRRWDKTFRVIITDPSPLQKHEGVQANVELNETRLTIKRSVNQPTGSSVVLAWISQRHLCRNLKLTFFAIFSLESRRARASISFDCETRLTSCVILAELIFAAGVLNQKWKIFKSKQKLTRKREGKNGTKKNKSLFVKEPSANSVDEDVAKQKILWVE